MDLFDKPPADGDDSADAKPKYRPLPERMRPRSLDEVVGQRHLIGPDKPLTVLASGELQSMIFWGPPGCGKTTIARLLAKGHPFKRLSAILSGVGELKKSIEAMRYETTTPVFFVDEIHRWNKAQQDALLPYVEDGTIVLIGATTENPSFSIISPLLSRCRLFVLQAMEEKYISALIERAHHDRERGLGKLELQLDDKAVERIATLAHGDARYALNLLETIAKLHNKITVDAVNQVFASEALPYDKQGEQHYDTISAFIKSMRESDANAAVYWLARMLESGENPQFIARRIIIFASEDIGNADPRALQVAVSAAEAFDRIGLAEGWIPLSQAATYLASAPKSNASYMAYKKAKAALQEHGMLPVPVHLRNAPTKVMQELGYGEGYQYAHDKPGAVVSHAHLPEKLAKANTVFYEPKPSGFENKIRELNEWRRKSSK